MIFKQAKFLLFGTFFLFSAFVVTISAQQTGENAHPPNETPATVHKPDAAAPLYTEFRGVRIGMPASVVREKLGKPKEKGDDQDIFDFSDNEIARVFYDKTGVIAIISTFDGKRSTAPTPESIIGMSIDKNADGSQYKMMRYPEAGYWVAYSRSAGDDPIIRITMQVIN